MLNVLQASQFFISRKPIAKCVLNFISYFFPLRGVSRKTEYYTADQASSGVTSGEQETDEFIAHLLSVISCHGQAHQKGPALASTKIILVAELLAAKKLGDVLLDHVKIGNLLAVEAGSQEGPRVLPLFAISDKGSSPEQILHNVETVTQVIILEVVGEHRLEILRVNGPDAGTTEHPDLMGPANRLKLPT
ncbi:hypothetical protein HG530_003983 [Fusarium avenaceum]|nr:hypothetical protein HG530_003983 [Fusarium avenaceum]